MPVQGRLKGRYEIKEVLGQGGMGVVYRATDITVKRDVALKTLRGSPDQSALELFQKECGVLASLSHPNIVEIFDIGEFDDEDGLRKPFFVMPLLPGVPLDKLIRNSSHRLTVERVGEIISQTCRGLHAAHERGLVHRDIKPNNLFVMPDDSVKIIDFGVAHMVDHQTSMGAKGTLLYMSPEQLEMKPLSALSDIFSLGVVCYEAFTQRRPFDRTTQQEVVEAILHQIPPPVSDLNPGVSHMISRVVHKAIAKQPWFRFSNARELGDTLQRALHNEPIEIFDVSRIRPRLERAQAAFEQSDYEYAAEILGELESEGHLDPAISQLRRQIDQAVHQRKIRQLLDSARTRFEEGEDPLALQKVQEVLQLDPNNLTAITLKGKIESRRSGRQIESWLRLAQQHIDNHTYSHARQALQNVLQLKPADTQAQRLMTEVDRLEKEYVKLRQEKKQLYEAALQAWQSGEVSTALTKMGAVLDLDHRAPDTSSPDRAVAYQNFYNQVRSEHDAINNAYAEARQCLVDRNFGKALALADQYLAKYPGYALFQALKFDVEVQQRQALSAYIAETDRKVEAEADLEKRASILKEALKSYPGEAHFDHSLRLVQEKQDLVNGIVAKARLYEERKQFTEALGQWEILRTIYSLYPGLDFETERVAKRREQQTRAEAKARWVGQIDGCLHTAQYAQALELLSKARAEFPQDAELGELERLARQGSERSAHAQQLLAEGQQCLANGAYEEGLEILRKARSADDRDGVIRSALVEALVDQARRVLDADWRRAEALAKEAMAVDPSNGPARSVQALAADHQRAKFVDDCLSQARRLHAGADLQGALAQVEQGLIAYPIEVRLIQARDALQREIRQAAGREVRRRDLEQLQQLEQNAEKTADLLAVRAMCDSAHTLAGQYPEDAEFNSLATKMAQRLETMSSLFGPQPPVAASQPQWQPVSQPIPTPAEVPPPSPLAAPIEETPALPRQTILGLKPVWLLALAGAVVTLAALIVIIVVVSRSPRPAPPSQEPTVTVPERVTLQEFRPEDLGLLRVLKDLPPTGLPVAPMVVSRPPRKLLPPPPPPSRPRVLDARNQEIQDLANGARDAYSGRNYLEPQDRNAIALCKRILELDPGNSWAKDLLDRSVQAGKYLVDQAIQRNDFDAGQRLAGSLATLLPGRQDIIEKGKDVLDAKARYEAAHRPKPVEKPVMSVAVVHLHPDKSTCSGVLSVSLSHVIVYKGESASAGPPHQITLACADVKEIKKNTHVFSQKGDFRIRSASETYNFESATDSPLDPSTIAAACQKQN